MSRNRFSRIPATSPDKEITLNSTMVTPENAAQLYQKLTVATD